MKAVQLFSEEYLQQCRSMSADEILHFLESFRLLHGAQEDKSRLISLKVPETLLKAFRLQCDMQGLKYQTQIKLLMKEWLTQQINSN